MRRSCVVPVRSVVLGLASLLTLGGVAGSQPVPAACVPVCIASAPPTAATNASVPFFVTASIEGCAGGASIDWDFGDGAAHSSLQAPTHRYSAAGSYTWRVTVGAGGVSCSKTGTIVVAGSPPSALKCSAYGTSAMPAGVEARFYGSASWSPWSGETITKDWDFGDGSPHSAEDSPKHTFGVAGDYTWTFTATSGSATCKDSGRIEVSATDPCRLLCSGSYSSGFPLCGDSIRFSSSVDQSNCTGMLTWKWDFGDGGTSSEQQPNHVFQRVGDHRWTLDLSRGQTRCRAKGTITVGPPTTLSCAGVATPRGGPPPLDVVFGSTFSSPACYSPSSVLWTLGNGKTSLSTAPSATFDSAGLFSWSLAGTADGRACGDAGPIVVLTPPESYTWARQASSTSELIEGVAATSSTDAWAASRAGLLRTTDAGVTWMKAALSGTRLYAIEMRDAQIGAVTGSCGFSRTADGGATWRGFWWTSCTGFAYTDVFPTSGDVVWLSTSSGDLERWTYGQGGTYNGWSQLRLDVPGGKPVWSISFTDPDNGLAVGSDGSIVRIAAASSATPQLTALASATSEHLYEVRMLSPTAGWIVGSGGTILRTGDGTTWTPQQSGTPLSLYGIAAADPLAAWVVGYNGVVLATANGGATWSPEINWNDGSLLSAATFPHAAVSAGTAAERLVLAVGTGGNILKRLGMRCPTITVTPAVLPNGTGGVAYSATMAAAGGTAPYVYSLASGALPDSVSLAPDGRLSGTPHTRGSFSFAVRAVDANGCSGERSYTVEVGCGVTCSASTYPSTGKAPLEVTFYGSGSAHACDDASPTFLWDFGDGTGSTESNPKHTYPAVGSYSWTLTVTAGQVSCVKTGVVHAVPCLLSCSAEASTDRGHAPLTVELSGTAECESTQVTTGFSWTLGDGGTAVVPRLSHTYAREGTYEWTMTAAAEHQSCERSGVLVVGASPQAVFWDQVDLPGWDFRDLHFTSPTEGWVAGRDATLLHTLDAGRTWTAVATGVTESQGFTSVRFLDRDTGWAGGGCSAARTTDRGATWVKKELACSNEWSWILQRLVPVSATKAWAVGKVGYTPTLFRFQVGPDGVMTHESWPISAAGQLYDLAFIEPQTALGVGFTGSIVRMNMPDGATPTVTRLTSGSVESLEAIFMLDATTGWVVGTGGTILRTTDGGTTWTLQTSGTTVDLNGVHFLDASTGWVVGDHGLVLATSDGGATWHVELASTSGYLQRVFFVDASAGFAVGTGDFALRLPCTALAVTPTSLPAGEAGRPYSASLKVSGGRSPYRGWVVAGRLPSGLSFPASGTTIAGTPAEVGTFAATVRVADGRQCTSDAQVTIAVGLPATCSVACSAEVPVSAEAGEAVTMVGSGAAFSCAGGVTFDWDFGDGSPHAGTTSVEHTYQAAGTYQWRLVVTASGATCSTTGSITVVQGVTYRYLVPSVAHLPGAGGTLWRTDVAAVNTAPDRATLTFDYRGATSIRRTATLGGRGALEHVNILESLFGMAPAGQGSGSLEIASNRPLAISSRTYNQTASGTYGQAYPALAESDALAPGQVGVLPQLKRTNSFRTNVGIANPGSSPVTVLIKLLNAAGAQVGSTRSLTATPGGWAQQYDIFSAAGAGMQAVACATVEVSGGRAWAYASLIDSATGDPTTIPVQLLRASGAATQYFVPSVAHLPGAGGTLWRTDLGLANRTPQTATLALTFRSSGNPLVLTRELAAHSAAEWGNVIESVLGLPPSSRTSGCLEVATTVPLALASRTYNQTESGTFGQLYPAISGADALQPGQVGLLPQLRKNASFRTNVGFVNLGDAPVEVAFTLFDSTGTRLGSTKVMSAEPGAWVQQYDVFAAVGAGSRDVAYATVEVSTPGGRAWAYASVVDAATGDPTTITVLRP